jgi:uncharacterized protein (TIGR02646 family)
MIKLNRPACPNPAALVARNYSERTNKNALRQSTHGKCMYCESSIGHIDFAHVEHIKPKAPDKFPQLEFVWENLGYACARCNNAKGDKYENATPFVDPYTDEPSDHLFAFGALLHHKQGNERGERTSREIELKMPELMEKRQERIDSINRALNACQRTASPILRAAALAEVANEAAADREYSLLVRTLIAAHAQVAVAP